MSNEETRELELARHRKKSDKYRKEGRAKPVSIEMQRQILREQRRKFPEANKARAIVGREVRMGRLIPEPCQKCGKKAQAHHPDHTKPLEVEWLCPKHHAEADNELRRQQRDRALATH